MPVEPRCSCEVNRLIQDHAAEVGGDGSNYYMAQAWSQRLRLVGPAWDAAVCRPRWPCWQSSSSERKPSSWITTSWTKRWPCTRCSFVPSCPGLLEGSRACQELHKYNESIQLAERKNHPKAKLPERCCSQICPSISGQLGVWCTRSASSAHPPQELLPAVAALHTARGVPS